jgi:methylase of polypeptide subunit release factors
MVDASDAACGHARVNAVAAGLDHRVEVRVGRLETSLIPAERFALVLADPPWVPSDDVSRFPEDPVAAIDGGADGLGPTRACLEAIDAHLDEHGCAIVQVGSRRHVEGIEAWLRDRPSLALELVETREFGQRGVLCLLRRHGREAPAC